MLNSVSKAIEYSTISSNYETYTNNTIKKIDSLNLLFLD